MQLLVTNKTLFNIPLPDGPFFYLLLSGIAATVIAVLELLYYVAETSRHRPGSSVWSVFKEEIGNAVRCSSGALHSPVVMVRQRGNGHCDHAADTIVETPSSIGCRDEWTPERESSKSSCSLFNLLSVWKMEGTLSCLIRLDPVLMSH